MRNIILLAVAAIPFGFAAPAMAAPCTSGGATLTIGATTYTAGSCRDNINNGNPGVETDNLEAAFGFTANSFSLVGKDGPGDPDEFAGIDFDVTATGEKVGNNSFGTWGLSWSEASGAPDLPARLDFIVGLFGGSTGAGYLFTNVLLPMTPTSGTGTFDIAFVNNGGNEPDLSHLTVAGRYIGPGTQVPEPAMVGLFGLGLLGIAARRRKNA